MVQQGKSSSWIDDYGCDLTVDALRQKYSPSDKFRVSHFTYPAGAKLNGSTLAAKCFAFAGSFEFSFKGFGIRLETGEWADLPAGSFELVVDPNRDAELVLVWEIPALDDENARSGLPNS